MAIKMVDGKWMMETTHSDGSSSWIDMNGAEETARQDSYFADMAQFRADNHWNNEKDYSSGWGGLFGSAGGYSTPSFGSGPNSSWKAALQERLRLREDGNMGGASAYELRTSTADKGYQERMYARNNAIEEMYRQGYSMAQINDHVTGKTNINSVDPDWSDYYAARNGAGTVDAAGLLSGEEQAPIEFWGDEYFKGGPVQDRRNPFEMGGAPNPFAPQSPSDQGVSYHNDRGPIDKRSDGRGGVWARRPARDETSYPSMPTSNPIAPAIPSSKPKGGFMGAYNARREELANKPSVMSLFDEMKEYTNE